MSTDRPSKRIQSDLTIPIPRELLAPRGVVDRDSPTMVPCPACAGCLACEGQHVVECRACLHSHLVDCADCAACGLCGGAHMVEPERAAAWRRF